MAEPKFERRMKHYAGKKRMRKGTREYNRYVYGTMSHRMKQKRAKRGTARSYRRRK